MDDHKIRRKHLAWAAPLLSLMLSAPALAADPPKQTGQGGAPGVVALEAVTAQATVQAVDHGARTATLRTEDGREIQVKAPDTVRNFDQVEVGDKVNVEYHEATAISVVKADAATPGTASGSSTAPGAGAPASDGASGTGASVWRPSARSRASSRRRPSTSQRWSRMSTTKSAR